MLVQHGELNVQALLESAVFIRTYVQAPKGPALAIINKVSSVFVYVTETRELIKLQLIFTVLIRLSHTFIILHYNFLKCRIYSRTRPRMKLITDIKCHELNLQCDILRNTCAHS